MFCKNCGAAIADTASFCPQCGTPTAKPEAEVTPVVEPVIPVVEPVVAAEPVVAVEPVVEAEPVVEPAPVAEVAPAPAPAPAVPPVTPVAPVVPVVAPVYNTPNYAPAAANPYYNDNQPYYGNQQPAYRQPEKELTEEDIPEKFRPMGAWSFFGWSLLFSIPFVGFILVIVFSSIQTNICRRNFARSFLCALMVMGIAVTTVLILAALLGGSVRRYF